MSVRSVLFVCLGNICRSPTAEGVFAKKAREQGLRIRVDSAGTAGYHKGASPDKRSQKVALARGYDLSKLACRKVQASDFEEFDWIIAMDEQNRIDLTNKCPEEYQHKIHLFLAFSDLIHKEVPDPYYGGQRGFELVLDLIEQASDNLIKAIKAEAA